MFRQRCKPVCKSNTVFTSFQTYHTFNRIQPPNFLTDSLILYKGETVFLCSLTRMLRLMPVIRSTCV